MRINQGLAIENSTVRGDSDLGSETIDSLNVQGQGMQSKEPNVLRHVRQ